MVWKKKVCFVDQVYKTNQGVKKGLGAKKKKEIGEEDVSKGKKGGGFTYHNSPKPEMHLVLFEDLIINRTAKKHSSSHADKGKSPQQSQTQHIVRDRLN